MDNGWFAKPVDGAEGGGFASRFKNEMTLDAVFAFWIALRMEMLNPPETSVPKPTCGMGEIA